MNFQRSEVRDRRSELDSQLSIEVHIEELVLHGFDPRARWNIGDALESELRELLIEKGLPAAWQKSTEHINSSSLRADSLTKPSVAGRRIARAVYGKGEK